MYVQFKSVHHSLHHSSDTVDSATEQNDDIKQHTDTIDYNTTHHTSTTHTLPLPKPTDISALKPITVKTEANTIDNPDTSIKDSVT